MDVDQPLKRIPLLKYFSKCQKQNEKIKLDGNNVCMIKKMFTKCQEKIDSKKAIGHEKIIGGIVLILFGICGIIFGVNVYNNQNFIHRCNSISGSTNQTNANTELTCINQSGISILSIVPIIIGIIILVIGIQNFCQKD